MEDGPIYDTLAIEKMVKELVTELVEGAREKLPESSYGEFISDLHYEVQVYYSDWVNRRY